MKRILSFFNSVSIGPNGRWSLCVKDLEDKIEKTNSLNDLRYMTCFNNSTDSIDEKFYRAVFLHRVVCRFFSVHTTKGKCSVSGDKEI